VWGTALFIACSTGDEPVDSVGFGVGSGGVGSGSAEGASATDSAADTQASDGTSDASSSGDGDTNSGDADTNSGDGDTSSGDGDTSTGDGDTSTGDGDTTSGDADTTSGDGDTTSGDGDGDSGVVTAEGDSGGDGDGTAGDGDGTTGDGDGDCSTPMGCTSDTAPDGESCGAAKIVGRIDAIAGVNYNGDTTGDGNDDDLGTNDSACWDAKYDNFYRLYLYDGDSLTVNLDVQDNDFNGMMKLYEGVVCENGGDSYTCYNDNGDGGDESLAYVAVGDGWRTVVVDGRMAFNDDYDWGPYNIAFSLVEGAGACSCG
jgi:hypothetical protein